ncbi:MAG: RING finger domain-containing protein [Oligoflexales bacterium]
MHITTRYPDKSEILSEEIFCCICYDPYSEGDELFDIDGCDHVFHMKCLLKRHLKPDNNSCPLCKFKIPEKNSEEVP